MNKWIWAILLFATSTSYGKESMALVSINHLIEQEVGRIVISALYAELGIPIKITPVPAKRAQHETTNGISDGEVMRIYAYGNANPYVVRVPTPYYKIETKAFVMKNRGIVINMRDDLKDYRIAKVRGIKHTNHIAEGFANVIDLNTTKQAMLFVHRNRADVALTTGIDGLMTLQKLQLEEMTAVEKPLASLDLYHYVHSKHRSLVPKVDALIKRLSVTGELAKIILAAENKVIEQSMLSAREQSQNHAK